MFVRVACLLYPVLSMMPLSYFVVAGQEVLGAGSARRAR